jgi:hypothetical protein
LMCVLKKSLAICININSVMEAKGREKSINKNNK